MYTYKEYPDFSWSNSRHKTFLDCRRKYYHQYYEAHNGWLMDECEERRSAYRLKNLKNLPILLGEEVHKIIDRQMKNMLEGRKLLTEDEMIKWVSKGLNEAYIDSHQRKDMWMERPKKYKMLHEIYYGQGISEEEVEAIKQKLTTCVHHFYKSQTFQDILNKLELKVLNSEEFRKFEVNGVDVFVVLDFVYQDVNKEKWIVIDWKTGKESDDDRKQLALYALYLSKEHSIPIDDIIIRNEYLLSGKSHEYKLNQFDVDSVEQVMNDSIYSMQQLLEDKAYNKPLGIECFQMNTSGKCNNCNYKEKCVVHLCV